MSIALCEAGIRSMLTDVFENYGVTIEVLPTLRGATKKQVVYQLATAPQNTAASHGAILYSPYLFRVFVTTVGDTISPIVDIAGIIKQTLHVPNDQLYRLPGGIQSMHVVSEIQFSEPTEKGDVRHNLGVLVRIVTN